MIDDPFRCVCPLDPADLVNGYPRAVEGCPAHRARYAAQQFALCGARTGVIWKLDGEVCSCIRLADHSEPNHPAGTWHVCSCNAWFDDSCVRWRPGEKGAA